MKYSGIFSVFGLIALLGASTQSMSAMNETNMMMCKNGHMMVTTMDGMKMDEATMMSMMSEDGMMIPMGAMVSCDGGDMMASGDMMMQEKMSMEMSDDMMMMVCDDAMMMAQGDTTMEVDMDGDMMMPMGSMMMCENGMITTKGMMHHDN